MNAHDLRHDMERGDANMAARGVPLADFEDENGQLPHERLTADERTAAKLMLDQALRVRLKVKTTERKALKSQCHGSTYIGTRCQNTATDGDYCYAHKT